MRTTVRISTVFTVLILLAYGFSPAFGQSKASENAGIDFFHGSFAEAKAKAAKENKLVFVDAYAHWCGPCKWMAANVFPNADVGKLFNEHFINMKMDMEKGEGRGLSRDWGIRGYPTLLFFDPAGKIVKKNVGMMRLDGFIGMGNEMKEKKI